MRSISHGKPWSTLSSRHGTTNMFPDSSPMSSLQLPFPASLSASARSVYGPFLRRSRLQSIIALLATCGIIYMLLSSEDTGTGLLYSLGRGRGIKRLEFSDDASIVRGSQGGYYGLMNAKSDAESQPEPKLVRLKVKEEPPAYPHPPLPREQLENPWPGMKNAYIANHYLSDTILAAPLAPPAHKWPDTFVATETNPPKPTMVKWEDLYRPAGYEGPVNFKALGAGQQGASQDLWRRIQTTGNHNDDIMERRREWVKKAFLHAWRGYKSRAWGYDEVKPMSGHFTNPFNAWGATIVDSLSTLLIMNLTDEYSLARTHIRQIDFTLILGERSAYGAKDESASVPVFETIIRYLGGMISAFDLSGGDPLMLERAEELAGWLMGAFDTRYGLPVGRYKFGDKLDGKFAGKQVLAEVGSFSLEFGRLAQITGKPEYYDIVRRATYYLENGFKRVVRPGTLLPSYIDDSLQDLAAETFGWGAQTDSYYEYLLKAALLFRNTSDSSQYLRMYDQALDSAYENGLISTVEVVPGKDNEDLTIISQLNWNAHFPILEHLACFAGGLIGMGAKVSLRAKDLETAKKLTKTCFWAYNATYTGLGPETMTFYHPMDTMRFGRRLDSNGKPYLKVLGSPPGQQKADRKFQGRPETIESVFYLWRITGDPIWQERGWAMFSAWVEHTISPYGFSGINNVNSPRYRKEDAMESYVLAETLKYYYLLFSPTDFLSLDEFVFNTEAHPFRLPIKEADASPTSFTPSWRSSEIEERLQEAYGNPNYPSDRTGGGTWAQLRLQRESMNQQ